MNGYELLDPAFSGRFCLMLLHSLWQAAFVAILAWMYDRFSRHRSASRNYAVAVLAMFALLAAMPVTYCMVEVPAAEIPQPGVDILSEAPMPAIVAETSPETAPPLPAEFIPNVAESTTQIPAPEPEVSAIPVALPEPLDEQKPSRWLNFAPWIVGLYALGVVWMLIRLVLSIYFANRLGRHATILTTGPLFESLQALASTWSLKVVPAIAVVPQLVMPKVIGILRPTILLPASAITGLSADDLQMILAHELAHIRRHDMWINFIQRLAEAALFFNPAIWYLSRRISMQREFCCDEIACEATSQQTASTQVRYAMALLNVVELMHDSSKKEQLSALAASGRSPSELRRRVARLFGEPLREPVRFSRGMILTIAATTALLLCGPTFWPSWADTNNVHEETSQASEKGKSDANVTSDDTPRLFRLNVVGPDGKPVPNASVEIRTSPAPTAKQIRRGKFLRASTYGPFVTTDENGQLEFELNDPPTRFNLSIKKPGFGPYWASWSSQDHPQPIPNEFTVKLDSGWSAGGIVVDGEGNPVEGVIVSPSVKFKKRPGVTSKLGVGTRIKTDAKGEWRFDLVPDSKKYVHVAIDHADYQALRISLQRDEYEIKLTEKPTVKIKLNRGLTVSGTVADENGKPIPDALVRTKYLNDEREAKTDKQGKYLLKGCEPKISQIVVTAKGKAIDMQKVLIDSKMLPVNFVMKPGGKIRIRVVDENGKGIPKAIIHYQRWRNDQAYFPFDRVKQYADENGIWEWNEAPLDEFTADIYRPGSMQLSSQSLIAGLKEYKEYTFSPPQPLVISGRVIDAKTKKTIKNYRAIPGFRFRGRRKNIFWKLTDAYKVTNGEYRFRHTGGRIAYQVRIEVDGYKAAVSRDIKPNEGKVNLDFSLESAKNVTAIIVTPKGKLAANAKVAIGDADSQINIKNGEFSSQTHGIKIDSSAEGRISFPARDEAYQLYILHPTGFAFLKSEEGLIPDRISLTPWARLEGTFREGNKIVPYVRLEVKGGFHSYSDFGHHAWVENTVTTDKNGIFVFDRVIPGDGSISRYFVHTVNQGPSEETSSKRVPVNFVAGKTIKLDLGRTGRPVVGKLVLPGSTKSQQLTFWKRAYLNIQSDLSNQLAVSPLPKSPESAKTQEQRSAWYQQWLKTEAGKTWQTASLAQQELSRSFPVYRVSLDRDGSFRIDNVPEGDYVINGEGITDYRFSIPPIKNGYQAEPFELGELISKVYQATEADEADSNEKKKPAAVKTSQSKPAASDQKMKPVASADSSIVRGTIAGADGKPVVGAMVWLAVKERDVSNYVGGAIVGQAKSTGDGKFNIALPRSKIDSLVDSGRRLNLWVWKPGLLLTMRAFDKTLPAEPVLIPMLPDPSVEILIRNSDGTPCSDATIAPLSRNHIRKNGADSHDTIPEPIRKQIAVRCNAQGRARIVGLDHQPHFTLETESPSTGRQLFGSSELFKTIEELQLQKTGAISGRLNAQKGSQADLSKVVLQVATHGENNGILWVGFSKVRPDRQGHFTIPVIAAGLLGPVQVQIDEPDNLELQAVLSLEGVVVKPNETTKFEIPMLKTVKITQIVRDGKTKEPLPYVRVQLDNQEDRFSVLTDKNGRFTVQVIPGKKYRTFYFLPDNYVVGSTRLLQNTTTNDVELEPAEFFPGRTIEGTVLDSSGKPFAGVEVGADWVDPAEKTPSYVVSKLSRRGSDLSFRRWASTDANGRFVLENVHSGIEIMLTVERAGIVLGKAVQVKATNLKPVTLKTDRFEFASIKGRVVDSNSKPVAGAEFHVHLLKGRNEVDVYQGFTDANGRIKTPAHFPKQYHYRIVIYSKRGHPDIVALTKWSHLDEVSLVVDPTKLKLREVLPGSD